MRGLTGVGIIDVDRNQIVKTRHPNKEKRNHPKGNEIKGQQKRQQEPPEPHLANVTGPQGAHSAKWHPAIAAYWGG